MSAAAAEPPAFPWAMLLATGLGALRLSPNDFWAMTPTEFAYAAGLSRHAQGERPTREDLATMMARHPDR